MGTEAKQQEAAPGRMIGRIPVRNIWFLFLYASNLARFRGQFDAAVEESVDLPDLIGRLLCFAVERRLRRNLSRGYRRTEAVLTRVRGRIDVLTTFSNDLLRRGEVACRFDEHTLDTPRNRLVRAALDVLAGRVQDRVLAHDCRRLAGDLGRLGVSGLKPSRAELSADQVGRHDADDLMMVTLSRLVFDLILPMEDEGSHTLSHVERDERLVRHLFEKAIGNFLSLELSSEKGWSVTKGTPLQWQKEEETPGIAAVLPGMVTDVILQNKQVGRRIVIDTKFTGIFTKSRYRETVLKSGYVYQLYAYLRSQVKDTDPLSTRAEGILLHPAIDADVDERVTIQGHSMRFMTVDLAQPTEAIVHRLRSLTRTPDVVSLHNMTELDSQT